jgi:hypothetical protein
MRAPAEVRVTEEAWASEPPEWVTPQEAVRLLCDRTGLTADNLVGQVRRAVEMGAIRHRVHVLLRPGQGSPSLPAGIGEAPGGTLFVRDWAAVDWARGGIVKGRRPEDAHPLMLAWSGLDCLFQFAMIEHRKPQAVEQPFEMAPGGHKPAARTAKRFSEPKAKAQFDEWFQRQPTTPNRRDAEEWARGHGVTRTPARAWLRERVGPRTGRPKKTRPEMGGTKMGDD